jgi:hypothetical protein
VFTRGYVTITKLVTPDHPQPLNARVQDLEDGLARVAGRDAQHAFWGQGNKVAQSLLHQLAIKIAR